MNIFNRITNHFSKVQPLPAGTHHMQATEDEKPYRIHLRLHADGTGILIVNAATILHLNPTAAEYAFHFIKGTSPEEAARQVSKRYRVDRKIALVDFNNLTDQIQTLIHTPDLDPVSYLDFERVAPHSASLTAPLRLDCALTYRLPPNSQAEYAPTKRVDRELTTEEWQTILDIAWQAGIPHITFTGGEPTLRDDLPALVAHAEKLGQVCGLLTDGLKLADKEYLKTLLQTGLDHVMIVFQPDNEQAWKAIETVMPEDLFVTVHLSVNSQMVRKGSETLKRLADLGVRNLSLSTSDKSLINELLQLLNKANSLHFSMRWDLPVPYSTAHPVAVETEEDKVPSGEGKAWLYVEPDGDVLPAQGIAGTVLGNLLRDDWAKIYKQQ
jgi:organic radical activating enzyme